jgi:hypothetical protein
MSPAFVQQPQSVSGAELVGGNDSLAAQAQRICAQSTKADRVMVLLGGNDVCNRGRGGTDPTENMYSLDTWVNALRAGLDQLAACLPDGARVDVLSMPRVDYLYDAGHTKGPWCVNVVWPLASICRIVTAEDDAGRRAQIGARIDQYNDATRTEVESYTGNTNGKNPRKLLFMTDWRGPSATPNSVGTFRFSDTDINNTDCFHPDVAGQTKLACVAWGSGPDGDGNVAKCVSGESER